ncbi:MAG: murein biosynthesis integral membrane protein MurJ [Planctomycetota bacterium]
MADALHKNTAKVGMAIMLSRILGLVREQVFAMFFGAGTAMDAYNVAFRVPNLLRDLFAEGAMSSAFVTVFSRAKSLHGPERAFAIGRKVITLLGLVVGLVVIAGIVFSPGISSAFAPDFSRIEGKSEMTAVLMAIMFPFLWLVSLSAVLMGVLNAFGRFGLPALAPSLFNVGNLVIGGLAAYGCHLKGINPIYGMAVGTVAGGFLQWGLLVPPCLKAGFRMAPSNPLGDPDVKDMMRLMLPSLLGLSAVQINIVITTNFASGLEEGAISWLGYAFRFMQLPIGVFGVAIATVSLPRLSQMNAEQDTKKFNESLTHSAILGLLLTLPASTGLWIHSESIIRAIYRYGSFMDHDVTMTASALRAYAVGLVAYAMVKIFVPAYYAMGKTRIPVIGTTVAIGVNLIGCSIAYQSGSHADLAMATSWAAMANLFVLIFCGQGRLWRIATGEIGIALAKIAASSAIMATFGMWMQNKWNVTFGTHQSLLNIIGVMIYLMGGGLVYFSACSLFGVAESRILMKKVAQKLGLKRR